MGYKQKQYELAVNTSNPFFILGVKHTIHMVNQMARTRGLTKIEMLRLLDEVLSPNEQRHLGVHFKDS